MSTEKYNSEVGNLEALTSDINTARVLSCRNRSLTGVAAEGTGKFNIYVQGYSSDIWYLLSNDAGEAYEITVTQGSSDGVFIPLNPQLFYGLKNLKFVLTEGTISKLEYTIRMV